MLSGTVLGTSPFLATYLAHLTIGKSLEAILNAIAIVEEELPPIHLARPL
jgi:hypothetical protein